MTIPASPFSPGDKVSDVDMNNIIDRLIERIHGGEGINTRITGGHITLESTTKSPIPARRQELNIWEAWSA